MRNRAKESGASVRNRAAPMCASVRNRARTAITTDLVSGTGPGSGTGWSRPPPGTTQPPPLPSWGGSTGAGAWQCDSGGQGSAWGRPSGAPLAAQGCGSPFAAPRGGALEPWLHSAGAVIGRGGRPTPRSRTCTCGRGWGSAQPEVWAGSLLRGSHIGRRPGSFRRAAIRWGGGGGG